MFEKGSVLFIGLVFVSGGVLVVSGGKRGVGSVDIEIEIRVILSGCKND